MKNYVAPELTKTTVISYHVRAEGTDKNGQKITVRLEDYKNLISGANPVTWEKSNGMLYNGSGFPTLEDAIEGSRYGSTNYEVRSVDHSTIEFHKVTRVVTTETMIEPVE